MAGEAAPEKKEAAAAVEEKPKVEADAEAPKVDLSKPVPRPDKGAFNKEVATLDDEVAVFNDKLSELDAKITEAKSFGGDQSDELREARATMKSLRERKDAVMRDRNEVAGLQKAARASLETKLTANRSLRSELKYTSPDEIEKRIAELEKKQSTTSMSLKDEKVLLKEIEQLKQSKKFVTQLTSNNDSISSEKKNSASISEQLSSKNAELDVLKKKIEEQKAILEGLNEENSERRAVLPALFKEKDALRKKKLAKVDCIKALRAEFRAAEKKYYDHQRALFALRKEAKKSEDEARRAEWEAKKKLEEEEELKRVPYEEEMELCKFLVNYLETTYLGASSEASKVAEAATPSEFEGLVLGGKKGKSDDADDYVSLNFGKKKGRGKKRGGQKEVKKIQLVPETIEIFGNLALEPPATIASVPETIAALKAKEAWYKTAERGAVKSIREKRKAEDAKPQRERRDDGDEKPKPKPKKEGTKGGFDATAKENELFPSLPGAPAKPAPPAPPAEEAKGDSA